MGGGREGGRAEGREGKRQGGREGREKEREGNRGGGDAHSVYVCVRMYVCVCVCVCVCARLCIFRCVHTCTCEWGRKHNIHTYIHVKQTCKVTSESEHHAASVFSSSFAEGIRLAISRAVRKNPSSSVTRTVVLYTGATHEM